jgi:hypothetical protein
MMKTLFKLPIIAGAMALLPAVAEAQRTPRTGSAAIGADVGVFRPSEDALDSGLALDGLYEYYMSPRVSLRLGLGWTNPAYDGSNDEHLRYVRIGGDLIHNWEGGTIHPFVGAGLGVYILEPREDGDSAADSESKVGGVLLGGIEMFTSNTVSIKGEVSYHLISNVDNFGPENPDGFKITLGLKKYF